MALPRDWTAIINSEANKALSSVAPDVSVLVSELANMLRTNIGGSDMPGGAKSALINSVSSSVTGQNTGVVSVTAMRPSIYSEFGLYGMVDLALIFNKRKQVKNAPYYNNNTGVFYMLGTKPGMVRAYNNNYLEKTASTFMAKHPECIVKISK